MIIKKTLLFISMVVVSFCFSTITKAEQTFDPVFATNIWTDNTKYTPQAYNFSSDQCIQTLTLLYSSSTPIYFGSTMVVITTSTVNNLNSRLFAIATTSYNTDKNYVTFAPSSTAGYYYPICVKGNANNRFIVPNNIGYYVSNASTTYTNAGSWDQLGYSSTMYSLGTPQPNDLWVDINGFSPSGEKLTSVNWQSTPTSTCDFQVWPTIANYQYSHLLEYGSYMGVAVGFGLATGSLDYVDAKQYSVNCTTINCTENYNGGVVKTPPLTPGQIFYATAYVVTNTIETAKNYYIDTDHTLAQSSQWEFIITGLPNENGCSAITPIYPDFTWPFTTSSPQNPYNTDMCSEIDTSNIIGQTKSAFCQAIQFLFKPTDSALNNFIDLKNEIATKPPFGYVSIYSNTINELNNSTSTTSTISSSNSSTSAIISTLATITIFSDLSDIFIWIFWLMFIFYIYKRFKHFIL